MYVYVCVIMNFELNVYLSVTVTPGTHQKNIFLYQLFKGSATKGNFVCLAIFSYYFKISFSFPTSFLRATVGMFSICMCSRALDERSLSARIGILVES